MRWTRLMTGVFLVVSATYPVTGASAKRQLGFTRYPASLEQNPVVEAARDKGLTIELYVRCRDGIGIVTASKAEGTFCGPDHRCTPRLGDAIRRLCRR